MVSAIGLLTNSIFTNQSPPGTGAIRQTNYLEPLLSFTAMKSICLVMSFPIYYPAAMPKLTIDKCYGLQVNPLPCVWW